MRYFWEKNDAFAELHKFKVRKSQKMGSQIANPQSVTYAEGLQI